jgi:uncharacterized membrane protein YraQ (UPF0718 family)
MIKLFADFVTYKLFKLAPEALYAKALHFFVYDTIKIFALLAVIIFAVSIIRSFISPARIKKILAGNNKFTGHILAGLLGIITPFCSCSAVPLFLGFVNAGVPLGVTFTFLVASPMINEIALVMLFGMFGAKIAAIYIVSGLLIAIVSGYIIGYLKVENLVNNIGAGNGVDLFEGMQWPGRLAYAKTYTLDIIKQVWPYILIGIGIGAWMHGYIPVGMLAKYAGADKWYAVPFATIVGIPLYSNAAGIIPLVSVLTEKGVALGTTLAFMMAVTGLSLPEFMILKTAMKTKLIIIFASIVGIGILLTGYLFNFIL